MLTSGDIWVVRTEARDVTMHREAPTEEMLPLKATVLKLQSLVLDVIITPQEIQKQIKHHQRSTAKSSH